MSRHRDVRNLNLDDEMDDDALSDGGEEEVSEQDQALLDAAMEEVLAVIGDADTSGLADTEVKTILWDSYFNVPQTIDWALGEQERRRLARDRKDSMSDKSLPALPADHPGFQQLRPGVPLIYMSQNHPDYDSSQSSASAESDHSEESYVESQPVVQRMLSTITEHTERTDDTLRTERARTPIAEHSTHGDRGIDPDSIPLSPSDSAVHRLSLYEPPPSLPPSDSASYTDSTPRQAPVSLPSVQPPSTSVPPKKVSKLSKLASARASSKASSFTESEKSGSEVDGGTVRTWSDLRPVTASIPPVSAMSSTHSSTSSHVRRAIATAMEMEALSAPTPPRFPSRNNSYKSRQSPPAESMARTKSTSPPPQSVQHTASSSLSTSRAPSSTSTAPSVPPKDPSPPPKSPSPVKSTPAPAKAPSKLALLAQAKKASQAKAVVHPKESLVSLSNKVDPDIGQIPKAGRQYTKILEPVANGDSVTTAITYSYESLRTLTDPSRRPTEALRVVAVEEAQAEGKKPSKLAAKAKKSQQQKDAPPAQEVTAPAAPTLPIFLPPPAARNRASPSAFATILVDDLTRPKPQDKHHHHHPKSKPGHSRHGSRDSDKTSEDEAIHRTKAGKTLKHIQVPDLSTGSGFKFNEPSPDDVVLRAREGTALGHGYGHGHGHKAVPSSPTQSRTTKSSRA